LQDIITYAEKYEVAKIVRLTGVTCSLPPWHFVSVLFNAMLSFSGRYHRMGEQLLLKSEKVKVSVIRPGGLRDHERDGERTRVQVRKAVERRGKRNERPKTRHERPKTSHEPLKTRNLLTNSAMTGSERAIASALSRAHCAE